MSESVTHEESDDGKTQASLPRRRPRWKAWMPLGIFCLTGVLIAVSWLPQVELEQIFRVVSTYAAILIGMVLLFVWAMFFSGWAVWKRLGTFAVVVLGIVGFAFSVQGWDMTGDVVPTFRFRWSESADKRLAKHRESQKSSSADQIAPIPPITEMDFPSYRGADRSGILNSLRSRFRKNWKESPPKVLYRQPIGAGYSGFVCVGNCLVTIEQRESDEAVVRYDALTGKEVWVHRYQAKFDEQMGGPGPRSTPTIIEGDVIFLGAQGTLGRLDGKTGKPKWTVNILDEGGVHNLTWGMAGSPLVVDGKVIVFPGSQVSEKNDLGSGPALVAYDAATGKIIWGKGRAKSAYSSPHLVEIAGVKQVVAFGAQKILSHSLATGEALWEYDWPTNEGICVAQPVLLPGNRLFFSSGYGIGCSMIEVSKTGDSFQPKLLWKSRNMKCRFTSPILVDDHLYGIDDGILVCLETTKGERKWKGGRYGHGQILLEGKTLIVLTETGEVVLVEAKPDAFVEQARFPAVAGKTWNNHALADGILYIRNHLEMTALDAR